ncbi:hypothetical protein ABZ832_22025 [Streptantibioticus parmotrematis]|uniref:hypothetical protein n=1 Tax=Streptantibioticus parmotrematis TaxID=2873249 RepID=UPI0033F28578
MDFFKPATTYFSSRPGPALPHHWRYFQCMAVTYFPNSDTLVAFGFSRTGELENPWIAAALMGVHWDLGWTVVPDTPPSSHR